jgi:hypothetical protein
LPALGGGRPVRDGSAGALRKVEEAKTSAQGGRGAAGVGGGPWTGGGAREAEGVRWAEEGGGRWG